MGLTEPWGQAGATAPRRRRRPARAVGLVLAVAAAAGCSADGGVDTETPVGVAAEPTPSATPAAVPTLAAREEPVLAAYREFFTRQTEISQAPAEQRRALLEPFTTEPALDRVERGMFAAQELGQVGYGSPVLEPTVAELDGDAATVTDCQDTSDVGRKDKDTGEKVTRGVDEVKVDVALQRGADGSWRVATIDYLDGPC